MKILGISAYYHDSAAALVSGEEIIAACQEERFTRKKHDSGFPIQSILACLKIGNLDPSQVESVVFFEKPFLKFERLIETYLSTVPLGWNSFRKALPVWLKEKLFQKKLLQAELKKLGFGEEQCKKILFSDHHLSHAASAFYPSPFQESLILTMDGVGEWATTSVAIGNGSDIKKIREIHFPHSLGLLYSAFTAYCGFKVNSGEYKLMGLAPYGKPHFADLIRRNLIDIKNDGSFALDMTYFNYCSGLTMTSSKFDKLFGGPSRKPQDLLEQRHMDLASSVQVVLEEVVLKMAQSLRQEFQIPNLCLAGGVALNCVANGKILEKKIFDSIWIQPAAGDAGGALGAALAVNHLHFKNKREISLPDAMNGAYLGTQFSDEEIEKQLNNIGARFEKMEESQLLIKAASDLSQGFALGWFQGSMEFGPRALGARSILGDPRKADMQKNLNLRVKFRESFRPFAPSVLREDVSEYFEMDCDSPYMLLVAGVKDSRRINPDDGKEKLFGIEILNQIRSDIPAVTHIDYSARIQTVSSKVSPRYAKLLKEFKRQTGFSVLINTSFNVRGEPIVESPLDAFHCFMGTDIERLAIGSYYLCKENQDPALKVDYKNKFELD